MQPPGTPRLERKTLRTIFVAEAAAAAKAPWRSWHDGRKLSNSEPHVSYDGTRLHSQTVTLLSCCLGSAHFTGLLPQRCRVIKSTLSHVHLAQATQRHSTIVVLMAIDPLRHRQLLVPNLRASIYSTGAPVHLCKATAVGQPLCCSPCCHGSTIHRQWLFRERCNIVQAA